MSKIKNGGPAFPVECSHVDGELSGRQTGNYTSWHVGLSMRDWFAAKALQGMLAYPGDEQRGSHHNNNTPEGVAAMAYEYADAMIRARGEA